ncbi:MAG: branched-chain amino acid ABC transporter substrate-binding protein [Actinomycetota bacterium]|nr:branched-chain amino acid ABC transporter substrate-binding protein [Actinomycetota bacterium]
MPRRNRTWRLVALLIAAGLVVAACGSSSKKASTGGDNGAKTGAKEYSLAYVGPLTGDSANLGINIRNGAKTAVQEFNTANPSYNITLKEFDTQGDPAQAPTVADKYLSDNKILGIVGPAFSGETKAVLPTLEENHLVMISGSATNTDLPNVVKNSKVFHRVLPDDAAQAAGIAKYLNTTLKPKTIAIVHDNSEYGKGLAVDQLSKQLGNIKLVDTEVIDPKGQDYSAAVNKVKAANPDVVFYGGYYEQAGRLKKQLADAGVKATFISGDGALDVGFVKAAGSAANGALLSCPCYFASDVSPGKIGAFAKSYTKINKGAVPGTYSTEAYDAANILMNGIKAGNTDRESLLKYVDGIKTAKEAISKDVTFAKNGNIKAQGIFIFEVKNGKIVLKVATDKL